MASSNEAGGVPTGKARIRSEIVEISRDLHAAGVLDDATLRKTTLRMLGRDALPKVETLPPAEIVALREREGLSQAVMAGFLNVAVSTVSQWERGERRPAGAALKLLHVVKRSGIAPLR